MDNLKPYRYGKIRFLQLMLVSMVVFGNQYAFNNPQALEESFYQKLHIKQTQFDLLYTIFAFPNIFATFIIGFLIDFLGVRIGLITLSSGVALFQTVVAIGGYLESYQTILVGRMLFGIASESLITAQASMISFWFTGKQLAFALGIAITFPELGNACNSLLSPIIYNATNSLGAPLMTSVGICLISVACAVWAAYLDKTADNVDLENNVVLSQSTQNPDDGQQIKCSDLKMLKGSFWLIVILCMFAVAQYVPFMDNANRLYMKRFCFTQASAGRAIMITYLIAAGFSAPLGLLVDYIGYKRYFIMGGMVIFTFAHAFIMFFPQCNLDTRQVQTGSITGLAFIGLGYCFYANCVVPSIPLVVKKKVTGTAFGIMQMVQSVCLAFFPLIASQLVQTAPTPEIGYRRSSAFFVSMGFLGFLASCGLLFISDKAKRKLDAKSKQKKVKDVDNPHQQNESPDSSSPQQATPTSESGLNQKLIGQTQRYTLEL